MKSKCIIDMYDHGATYDPKRHSVPALYWNDVGFYYWGWIYDEEKIVGDFTAGSAQAAEKALGVRFKYD